MKRKTVSGIMLTLLFIGMLTLAFNFKLDSARANPAPSEAELPVYKVGEYWYVKYQILTNPHSPWNYTRLVIGEDVISGIDCYVMNLTYEPDTPWNNTGMFNDLKSWVAKSSPVVPVKREAHGYTASSGYDWVWNQSFTYQIIEGPDFWPIMVNKALKLNTTTTEDVWITAVNGTPITPIHSSHKEWFNVTWGKVEVIENVTVLGVTYKDCFKIVTYDETNTTVISRAWYSPEAEFWVKIEDYVTQEYHDLISFYKPAGTRYSWSMFRHDLGHTGYSESPAPSTNQTLWNYTTGHVVSSSPAVAYGKVYVGSSAYDSKVYCLNALTGAHIWNYTTGNWIASSPAVAYGKVYVGGSEDNKVYCLDAATGAHIWNYTTGGYVYSSPAVADGKVYVGSFSYDDKVYCLDALTGAHIWNYTTGDWIASSPAVAYGKVYVGSLDNKTYCLDAATGAQLWNYTTGGFVLSSPAVAEGKVYVGSDDNKVYCLNALTGAHIWNYTTGDKVFSSPAVAYGKVYVGSDDNKTYCLNASTGAYIWSYTTGDRVASSPAVADGKVFVGSLDDKVYCLNASTGDFIWSYTTGNWVSSSPAVADGVVYVGSYDHKVYAFGNVIRVPEDFPTVQEAIDAATPGATILIAPGIYREYLVINKTLTIIGLPGSGPIFDGGVSGIAFNITCTAPGTIITNIIITNYEAGILINSSECKIYNNIMSQMNYTGITLEGNNAANNSIFGNTIYNNAIAINLTESSTSNTIYGNTISSNTIGLNLAESSGNIIYANTILGNDVGIDMSSSSGNTIYHNNFIGNTQQVSISGSSGNIWDKGYPSGGNYWSDYTGVDEKSGPNQNQPGSDGIGDTPYTKWGITDRYPLMNQWPCQITPRFPVRSVGGIYIPVNKLELLAPYIGLTILLAVAVVTVGYVKKRKRQRNQLINKQSKTG